MRGASASSGRRARTRSTFVATSCSAKSTLVPYEKSRVMPTFPSLTLVCIRSTLCTVESAASSGFATVSSSTTGSTPGLLMFTRTCG
ncbi:hypothetical protein D3C83_67350 [compost metagenome]